METAPETTALDPEKEADGILLETPIKRGATEIARVVLRRPSAGEMRGLQLQSLMQSDVNGLLALLPRITVPPLTQPEVESLSPVDLAQLGGEVQGFFMSTAERAMIAKVMGVIDQETSTG